jgi:hypothetical protein
LVILNAGESSPRPQRRESARRLTLTRMGESVAIDRDALEELLWLAKRGDVALSRRRLRHAFRHIAICSGAHREPDCPCCQSFTAAEAALAN